jgi:FkbM family methyltransferase
MANTLGAPILQRAWNTLRKEGLSSFVRKTDALLRRERERDRQIQKDAQRSAAKLNTSTRKRGLFLDCGSNLGQGFSYFSGHFPLLHYDFVLIEPNPHCTSRLMKIVSRNSGKVQLITAAASTTSGTIEFYGISDSSSDGRVFDGASIVVRDGGWLGVTKRGSPIQVRTFSFSALLEAKAKDYDTIVVKMDIEGAEYEVLEDMLAKGIPPVLDTIYVEFHSAKMISSLRSAYEDRERKIIEAFRDRGIPLRLWR